MSAMQPEEPQARGLQVFVSHRPGGRCGECNEELGRGRWVFLAGQRGALCLGCADLDHLVFLPAGDAALSRRSRTHSRLSAVVLEWSRSRRRYERQGLLVEEAALVTAEAECLADAEARARARRRRRERDAALDREYVAGFAARVRELYPGCPEGRAREIAGHACRKYSGRVGRSAAAKGFDVRAIRLAVTAHVRHTATDYDELLARGCDRHDARETVRADVETVLVRWGSGNIGVPT